MLVDHSQFEFKEKDLPREPSYDKSHTHSRSSASINREDIERAKQSGRPLRCSTNIPEDTSESVAPSVSTSTAMHRMVDGLVASDVSESHGSGPYFLQNSLEQSPPTPTVEDFEDGAYESSHIALRTTTDLPTEHEIIRQTLPSIFHSPFAPQPGEADSPHTRPGTAHEYPTITGHPTGQSSNTRFQEALLRHQQELEMQQSSVYDLPTTSLSQPTSSTKNARFLGREISPVPSPFTSSPSVLSATFPSYDVPRQVPQQPRFGAIGQTPPSGQGG